MESAHWSLLVIVVLCATAGCLQIYWLHRFRSMLHLVIVQKRYSLLVTMEAAACIVLLFCSVPLMATHRLHISNTPFVTYTGGILSSYLSHFIGYLEACRLWLISFDLHYLRASANAEWKSQIDASAASKDWYLQNKHKFGNQTYMLRRASIYFVFASTLTVAINIYSKAVDPSLTVISNFTDSGLMLLPLLVIVHCYYRAPKKQKDTFLFLAELKLTTLILLTGFALYIACSALFSAESSEIVYLWGVRLNAAFTLCAPSLVSTMYISLKIASHRAWIGTEESEEIMMAEIVEVSRRSVTSDVTTVSPRSFMDDLCCTVRDATKFEEFVAWILREFSSEIILSFVEFWQFKQRLKELLELDPDVGDVGGSELGLSDEIPKSTIVFSAKMGVDGEGLESVRKVAS